MLADTHTRYQFYPKNTSQPHIEQTSTIHHVPYTKSVCNHALTLLSLLHLAGGVPVLIAVIGLASETQTELSLLSAAAAVGALHSLTSRDALLSGLVDKAENLMLQLQALPRLSSFLRSLTFAPTLAETEEGSNHWLALCTCNVMRLNRAGPCFSTSIISSSVFMFSS